MLRLIGLGVKPETTAEAQLEKSLSLAWGARPHPSGHGERESAVRTLRLD